MGLCVLVTLCGIFGVIVSSTSEQIYGITTWTAHPAIYKFFVALTSLHLKHLFVELLLN